MKLLDFIPRKAIVSEIRARDKKGAIEELVRALRGVSGMGRVKVAEITKAVMERERLGSTGIGRGVAVPHARTEHVTRLIGAFGRSKPGLPFDSIDGEDVHLLFLILAPPNDAERYHEALQAVMRLVRNKPNFCTFLQKARSQKDLEETLREAEETVQV